MCFTVPNYVVSPVVPVRRSRDPRVGDQLFGDKFHFTLDPVLHKVLAFAAAPLLPSIDLTLTRVHTANVNRSEGGLSPRPGNYVTVMINPYHIRIL